MPWLTPVLGGSKIAKYNPILQVLALSTLQRMLGTRYAMSDLRNFCPHSSDVRLVGSSPPTLREFHTTTEHRTLITFAGQENLLSTVLRLASQLRQRSLRGPSVYDVCGTLRLDDKLPL
jgi:hypothetical protein